MSTLQELRLRTAAREPIFQQLEQKVKVRLALEMNDGLDAEREATDIARAIQPSKADMLQEQLVLLQLTRQARSAKVSEQFLKAPQLAHCRQRVAEAGSELQPDWAGGAWLLTPLSEHLVFSLWMSALASSSSPITF